LSLGLLDYQETTFSDQDSDVNYDDDDDADVIETDHLLRRRGQLLIQSQFSIYMNQIASNLLISQNKRKVKICDKNNFSA
jgi:hypothetical protein